jgi:hypothetical protein
LANQAITRTVRGETKKRLSIEGSYIDSLIVGATWTKIRLGMRFSVTHNASVSSPPSIYFGLASSSGNVVGQPTPKHFLGVKTNAATWGYGQSTINGSLLTSGMSTVRIISGSESANAIGVQGGNIVLNNNAPVLACSTTDGTDDSSALLYGYFIEITKGSPNYNIALWAVGSTDSSNSQRPNRNITNEKFMDYMDAASPPTGTNQLVAIGNTNYAINEATDGVLDTVNVAWMGSAFPIEIANLEVKVVS